ncbi:MAG: cardiolipin synthase [Verrucomicrobiaceae bacterium]|nr:cardiolipin synthase [Verrucomicrobiaceae bacterium]
MVLAVSALPFSIWDWHWSVWCLSLLGAAAAFFHIILYKRDPRSAAYWVALVTMVPALGAVLYLLLGINVIRRRGKKYRHTLERSSMAGEDMIRSDDGAKTDRWHLGRTLNYISRLGIAHGNLVDVYRNGDEAMEPMIKAIRRAQSSVALATYIFEVNGIGADFVEALADAVRRGVEVRVIVDDAGTRYAWPSVIGVLSRRGVPVQRFMPIRRLMRLATMNLRNHRKILVIDGCLGFTGGMNIREGNMLSRSPASPVRDLHFRVEGPVVEQMQRIFAEDWNFCAGEVIQGGRWFPPLAPAGTVSAIGIPDGPDEDIEVMPVAFFAALSAARSEVKILNPYFLPTPTLIWALKLCVMRGVRVTIVTPARNNIPPVAWAARTLYPELLQAGCRIFESAPPFDHSKLFLIDGTWSFIGSTNWDPRSLRLNFEFNLACCDCDLAARLDAEFQQKISGSRELTLADIAADSPGVRLRNGIARLFIPLL